MRPVVEFGLHLIARIAGARDAAGAGLGIGAAALNHEAFDHAMERRAVIKTLASEFLEVLDVLRRDVRPELEGHVSIGGLDDGVFFGSDGSAHKERSEPPQRTSRKSQKMLGRRACAYRS